MKKSKNRNKVISFLLIVTVIVINLFCVGAAAEPDATPLTSAGGTLAAGRYILTEDIKLEKSLQIQKGANNAVTIDLNGHVLEGPGSGSVIINNGHLTLIDSQPEAGGRWFRVRDDGPWEMVDLEEGADTTGYTFIKGGIITGGRDKTSPSSGSSGGGAIKMGANDTAKSYRLYFNGGTLVGNHSTRAGGAVYGGMIEMTGGAVIGNYADMFGGGLSLSGYFYMSGGVVERNNTSPESSYNKKAESGNYDNANIIIGFQSQFTMTGGTIRGNISTVYNTGGKAPNFDISGGLIEGNFRLLNQLTATFSGGELKGYVYMNSGTCNVENEAWIHNGSRKDGGGVCIRNGTFNMTGGLIENGNGTETGGAIHIDNGTCTISGGTIQGCSSVNGGAIYMSGGTCTISKDALIQNCTATKNGGAICMDGGDVFISGGSISNNIATENGGAALVSGGSVVVSGGSVSHNTAGINGGAIAVNNGNYKMTGGNIDNNKSNTGSGGGIYVSADGTNVTVDVLSGSVSNNTSTHNGGALAVVGNESGTETINVTIGVKKAHFDENGAEIPCEHGSSSSFDCPIMNNNSAVGTGGAIYVTGNEYTFLNLYCLTESGSSALSEKNQSNFMKVEGGNVVVSTSSVDNEATQNSTHGKMTIASTLYVTGGKVDIWGSMESPRIISVMTVDIQKAEDHFKDHRKTEGYYKLHYYENFTDPVTGVTTGQYKAKEIKIGDSEIIDGSIYGHPGYTISGWNTDKFGNDDFAQGSIDPNSDRGWYAVGGTYTFDGNPVGDLIIYAVWEPNGYKVIYNPNVPAEEEFSGEMPDDGFTYDLPVRLQKNQYKRPGYTFSGWSKNQNGPAEYTDEQEVTNLTTKKGEVVTLYAQWTECNHDPNEHDYTYSVIDNGATLRRDCSCEGYSETVKLTAGTPTYDQQPHSADIEYSSTEWQPSVVYTSGEDPFNSIPVNAGIYTASVSDGGKTASITYTIAKAEQPGPDKPIFEAFITPEKSTLNIKPVDISPLAEKDDTYDSVREYQIVYYSGGIEYSTGWILGQVDDEGKDKEFAVEFELNMALTNYYVYARYSECANYKASDATPADSVYFFVGDVKVHVDCGTGVKYTLTEADGSDVTTNGISLNIDVYDGYYFPKNYGNTITCTTITSENDTSASLTELVENKEYQIANIPESCDIYITLPSVPKQPVVNAYITEKQVFGNVTGTEATISRDSAYTVYYDVDNYNTNDYAELQLSFDTALPEGTTIILFEKQSKTYYWKDVGSNGLSSIYLTDFVKMGTANTKFALSSSNLDLQFIIDFSKIPGGVPVNSIKSKLSIVAKPNSGVLSKNSEITASLKNVGSYDLDVINNNDLIELVYTYTPSAGIASKWDNRDIAIVLTPTSDLPSDAHIVVSTNTYKTDLYENHQGNFIIPLSSLSSGRVSISLTSSLFSDQPEQYNFSAKWMISRSVAELSPENGVEVANTNFTVTGSKAKPVSIKVTAGERLYTTVDTVEAIISWSDIPSHYKVTATLMRKGVSGNYSSTGWSRVIDLDLENPYLLEIPLRGQQSGSYQILISVEAGLEMVSEAYFYFIIE